MNTLNLPTMEDLYQHVVTHLIKQGTRAVDMSGECLYLTGDGLKCAIGSLITDEDVAASLLGSVFEEDVYKAVEASIGWELSVDELDMLVQLQRTHDTQVPEQVWASHFARFPMAVSFMEYRNRERS